MFTNVRILIFISSVFLVRGLVVPPSHVHNDVVDQYEQDVSQVIDRSDLLMQPFDSLTLLKDSASNELESNYYNAIDLEKVNNSTIECITEQAIILKEAIEKAKQQLKNCLDEGAERYGEAIQGVEDVKKQIQIQIDAGKEIVKNCSAENAGDVIAIVKCIEEKGKPVREALIELAGELRKEINKAEAEIAAIIEDTRECLKDVVKLANAIIQAIVADIKECISNPPAQ